MHRRRAVAACAFALLTVVAGACGGDDGPTTVPTTVAAGGGCALITQPEMAELVDRTLGPAKDTSQGDDLGCVWTSTEAATADDVVLVNFTYRPSKASTYDSTVAATRPKAEKAEDVVGVGDAATYFVTVTEKASAFQMLTRKGDALAFITIAGRIDEAVAKAAATAALQKALSRA